jgi:hypothetical protein
MGVRLTKYRKGTVAIALGIVEQSASRLLGELP